MTIEVLAFNNHELDIDGITTHVDVFGNCILTETHNDNDNFFFFSKNEGIPALLKEEKTLDPYLNPDVRHIKVKDQLVPVIHDLQYYHSKGIILEHPDKIVNHEFLRGLIPEYSDLFWMTREEIAKKIPIDLPVLLELREWHHPDLAMGEKPSENETFQQYRPAKIANTHWINWPRGGAL